MEDSIAPGVGPGHRRAVAAMLLLRSIGARMELVATQTQALAPHHLVTLQAVHDGAVSLAEVALRTDRHVSSVSRAVDALVGEGLVDRVEDPTDRRQLVLRATEAGATVARRVDGLDRAMMLRIVASFDETEADALASLLERMVASGATLVAELEADPGMLDRVTLADLRAS